MPFDVNYTSCHAPPLQGSDIPSNRRYMFTMITSFSLIMCHSCKCLQISIYSLQIFFIHIINTTTIRVLQKFHHHHGDCRILANGTRIFNSECCYCFTTVLGQRPRSNHPWHSLKHAFTQPSFGHLPATCYTNYLKMSYLDVFFLH